MSRESVSLIGIFCHFRRTYGIPPPPSEGGDSGAGAMRILVVGSGGREHALCWKIAASPLCDKLYCAPGNAGIAADAECVPIGAEDIEGVLPSAKSAGIDFVVIGP